MPKFHCRKLGALSESDLQVAAGSSIGTGSGVKFVVVAGQDGVEQNACDSSHSQTGQVDGDAANGKANATRMSLDALCRYFNIQTDYQIIPPAPKQLQITADDLSDAYLQMYDPRRDSNALKTHPELFEKLRGDYPLRREKEAYTILNNPE